MINFNFLSVRKKKAKQISDWSKPLYLSLLSHFKASKVPFSTNDKPVILLRVNLMQTSAQYQF